MKATMMTTAVLLLVMGAGCAGESADVELERRLETVQVERDGLAAQLDESDARHAAAIENLRTERDELAAQLDRSGERHDASLATIEAIEAILEDPDAFGSSEAEIIAALSEYATDTAVMDDVVFGAIDWTVGVSKTLYEGSIDARIDVYDTWLSDDGSQGGALWVWYGTNFAGNPFELIGISLSQYDENGKVAYELVSYPYPDEYVEEAISGAGTTLLVTAPNQ